MSGIGERVQQLREHIENGHPPNTFVPESEQSDTDSSTSETKQQSHRTRTIADLDSETMVWRTPASSRNVVHTHEDCRHVSSDHRQIKCQKLHADNRVCKECGEQLSREWLYQEYIEKERSSEDIAEEFNVTGATIRKRLSEVGIETRPGGGVTPDERLKDETWMREQYIDGEKSISDIAEITDCSHTTARRWLRKHDIEIRARAQIADARLQDPEWLRARYHGDGLTQAEIGELCDCCGVTVGEWMNDHGIETRDPGRRDGGSQ
jgi:hypothetical protein